MTTRELPAHEWSRLTETEIPAVLPYMDPRDVRIMVVEDGDRIVGAWAVLRVVQLEGVWIAPEYRTRVSVARRLLIGTLDLARQVAPLAQWVYTGADTPAVARLLTKHLGALKLPYDAYLVPIRERLCPTSAEPSATSTSNLEAPCR